MSALMSSTVTLEEIYAPVERSLESVSGSMVDILSHANELTQEVVRYFFSVKGKQLRPALTLLGAALKTADTALEKRAVRLGAALEIFHSATLIHDDIIDDALIRRNLQAVHLKWTPKVAVLAGDYFHDQAIKAIFEIGSQELLGLFLKTAGEVCDGEIRELRERHNFDLTEAVYLDIIDKKTASLLACALAGGAILAGAGEHEKNALLRFGLNFGRAFQVVDDLLDLTGTESDFGKTLGADCMAGVLTLPFIHFFSSAGPAKREALMNRYRQEFSPANVQAVRELLRQEGSLDYAVKRAREFSESARHELAIFEETPARRSLERLLDYVLERNK